MDLLRLNTSTPVLFVCESPPPCPPGEKDQEVFRLVASRSVFLEVTPANFIQPVKVEDLTLTLSEMRYNYILFENLIQILMTVTYEEKVFLMPAWKVPCANLHRIFFHA